MEAGVRRGTPVLRDPIREGFTTVSLQRIAIWFVCSSLLGSSLLAGPATAFRRGDSNGDGKVDLSDGVNTLGFLFLGAAAPTCLDAADANDSSNIDLSDGVFTFGYLFLGNAAPPAPGPVDCGPDPSADGLSCAQYEPANTALRCATGELPFTTEITVPPRSLTTVSLHFDPTLGDLDLTAHDGNGACLGGRPGSACTWTDRTFEKGEEHLSVLNTSTTASARFTFRVEGHNGATNDYTLSSSTIPWRDGRDCATLEGAPECEGRSGAEVTLVEFPFANPDDAFLGDAYRFHSPTNYRWLRRELIQLVRFALAETQAKFPGTKPLGLLDMCQRDGITPGYDIGSPRHPESTHDQGGNIDIAYFTTLAASGAIAYNLPRIICDAQGGNHDGSFCNAGAAQTHVVDLERQVYFMAKLYESSRLRVLGVDRVIGPILQAEATRQLGLGWITQASRDAFQSKLGFGDGWPFQHHHMHVSLRYWTQN